jgi:hypothetical protein
MSCEICGRSNCVKSFHSLEEQDGFDEIADKVKERAKRVISNKINKLNGHEFDQEFYVKLNDVIDMIEEFD